MSDIGYAAYAHGDMHDAPEDIAYKQDLAALREEGLPVPEVGVPAISEERLDLNALWRCLPEAERERIGELALGIVVGGYVAAAAETTAPTASRAFAAHYRASSEALFDKMPETVIAALQGPSWRLPVSLGSVCTGCGCSEHDACADGCRWMDEGRILCTACGDPDRHIPF